MNVRFLLSESKREELQRESFVFLSRVRGGGGKSGEEYQVIVSLSPAGAIACTFLATVCIIYS